MLLYGLDELERVDEPKIQAGKSGIGDVFLSLIVGVSLMPSINVDPQFTFGYEFREAVFVEFPVMRAIVV